MSQVLRTALIQMRSTHDPVRNRADATPLIGEAASAGARLIATPENTVRMDRDKDRLFASVGPEEAETEIKAWGRMAAEHGVWLLLGSCAIQAAPRKIYNRSFLFSPDGKIAARYDKIHMFDVDLEGGESYRESETVEPGRRAVVVEGPAGAKFGLTICYDLRFAALYAALAQAGAAIITVPAAFTVPTGKAHWEVLLRARAIETGAFVIAPAQGGTHEDGRLTWGHSMTVAPWGEVIAELDHDAPGVLIADLNLAKVADARAKVPAWRGGREFSKAMIHYALRCDQGDEFEAWFSSMSDYDKQAESGLVECPHCGSTKIEKAPMAPAVLRKDRPTADSQRAVAMAMAAQVKQHIQEKFDYVGEKFADEARKIHDGAADERPIWGEATPEQAQALVEDGIAVAPLPPEIAPTPPRKLN